MDSDDGGSFRTASTDTSMFMRELEALNARGNGDLTGVISTKLSESDLNDISGSGDPTNTGTLLQAMETIVGGRQAQLINLQDNVDESSVSVYSHHVEVYVAASSGSCVEKSSGSNKVKITPVVNHMWELKYYQGNLVAVHHQAVFVAYVLTGKYGGNVRVLSRKTAHRVLLKHFQGAVMDIAFALSDDVQLAAADESGNLMVYSLNMEGDNIVWNLVLHIEKELYNIESDLRSLTRVVWCPYMPEDETEPVGVDAAKMLVLLHGTQAEVWNVDLVAKKFGNGPVSSTSVSSGVMCIESYEPMMLVVNAAFAPDGSAIAVAYHSGLVKFFLVDLQSEGTELECMYDWNPHDGNPVSSMYFLDDHKHSVSDVQLWKFALTGAHYNTEIKLWSCETWACVQMFRFNAPLSQPNLQLRFKSEIDLTSKYLALSDINSRVLYVLQIQQNYSNSTVHVSSMSQFSLAQPCLSFAIFDAGMKRFQHSANDSHLDEITTGELNENQAEEMEQGGRNGLDSDDRVTTGVQIKMYGVHTKSLQELLIRYRPDRTAPPPHTPSLSMSQEETGLRDLLSDVSIDQSEASQDLSHIPLDASQAPLGPSQPFESSSPSLSKGSLNPLPDQSVTSSTSSFTHVTAINDAHSPHSSLGLSTIISPASTFSQTPSHSRPFSGGNVSLSDVPLPPVTSAEEDELATPKHSDPSSSAGSVNPSVGSNQDLLEDLFSPSGLGTSATGSFPVGNLLEAYNNDDKYDENDKEVAEALGLEKEEEAEDKVNLEDEKERKDLLWPEPPDVSTQAKRLVEDIIVQSTHEEEDKENDFSDDENDEEAEVEEIIQCHGADDVEDGIVDYSERSDRHGASPAPVQVLTSIDASIARLAEQLEQQQELMQQMQAELNRQRDIQLQLHRHQIEQEQLQHMAAQQPSLQQDISKLEDILVSRMEHSLAQHMQRETQRLQDSLKLSDRQRKERDEALHTSILQELSRNVKDSVATAVRTEVKQTVSPALHRFVEPMKEKIHQEVAHRLTACDTLLKDNIAKAVKSRSVMDVLATSVGDVIYQQMQQAYTDTFRSAMLPALKTTLEKTLRDVHGIFQQGTKEYQLYIRQTVDHMLRERVASEEIVTRMESSQHQFLHSVAQIKTLVLSSVKEELAGQVLQAVSGLREALVSDVRKIMKEEMSTALKEHGASISESLTTYLRSGAATPVPLTSEEEISKERIMRELRSGRINDAFQCALSAGNLDLVVYTCEAAKPLEIFAQSPCPLSQPVLLSLISQLSANLEKNFELKMKYLEEAVTNLDPDQHMTAEHIPNVLGGLVQKLRTSEAHGGDPRKIKAMKILVMAANSLLT